MTCRGLGVACDIMGVFLSAVLEAAGLCCLLPSLLALRVATSASSSENSWNSSGTSASSFHEASVPRCL